MLYSSGTYGSRRAAFGGNPSRNQQHKAILWYLYEKMRLVTIAVCSPARAWEKRYFGLLRAVSVKKEKWKWDRFTLSLSFFYAIFIYEKKNGTVNQ